MRPHLWGSCLDWVPARRRPSSASSRGVNSAGSRLYVGKESPVARRILMYSQDGLGLGHLRRARNIACEVLTIDPDCSILVVADSPATPFFSVIQGVDYLKLPTVVKRGVDLWRAETLQLETDELVSLRAALIQHTFQKFRPDVVLVDHMPLGVLGELK